MNGNVDDPHRYDDIIDLPHFTSKTHPRMSPENRAAQFAPFAALVGYDAVIKETARLTDKRMVLDEDEKLVISSKLQLIQDNIKERPEVAFTYFLPDAKKSGGAYVVITGKVKKVDEHQRAVVMASGEVIPIDEVIAIDGEMFRGMDGYFA